jgi:hypothetical protein
MVDQIQVGPATASDGATPNARGGRNCETIVSQYNARQFEAVRHGAGFSLTITNTTTIGAGNITGAAAASANTNFSLWNPVTSGVVLVLRRFYFAPVSGTLVGGPLLHNFYSTAIPTIASVGTAYNRASGLGTGPAAKFVASAAGTTVTGGSALVAVGPSTITYSAGTYAALAGSTAFEDMDGRFVILPGAGWTPCVAAAGTSVLAQWGVDWDEVPV